METHASLETLGSAVIFIFWFKTDSLVPNDVVNYSHEWVCPV